MHHSRGNNFFVNVDLNKDTLCTVKLSIKHTSLEPKYNYNRYRARRVAVVLNCYQCDPGSKFTPGTKTASFPGSLVFPRSSLAPGGGKIRDHGNEVGTKNKLSVKLLILILALFFSGFSIFPPSTKTNLFQIPM